MKRRPPGSLKRRKKPKELQSKKRRKLKKLQKRWRTLDLPLRRRDWSSLMFYKPKWRIAKRPSDSEERLRKRELPPKKRKPSRRPRSLLPRERKLLGYRQRKSKKMKDSSSRL